MYKPFALSPIMNRISPRLRRRSTARSARVFSSASSRSRNNSVLRSASTASLDIQLVCHRQSSLLNIGLAGFDDSGPGVRMTRSQSEYEPAQHQRSDSERCIADQPEPPESIHHSGLQKL